MSGMRGNCIVCGKTWITGHEHPDEYRAFQWRGQVILACAKCVPYLPICEVVHCSICDDPMGWIRDVEGTYYYNANAKPVCDACVKAKEHIRLHERMELIAATETK